MSDILTKLVQLLKPTPAQTEVLAKVKFPCC